MTAVRELRPQAPMSAVYLHDEEHRARTFGTAEIAALSDVQHWREAEPSVCRLVFQCASRSLLSCGGSADLELTAGNWTAHVSPAFELQTGQGSEVVSLAFPSMQLSRTLLMQARAAFDVPAPMTGAAQMCLELARTCLARAELVSDAVSATLGDSLVELAKLAIIERSSGTRGETVRETVRTRILGLVNRNLTDPDLTIERIAQRMRCTKRYLHKVFTDHGETLSQYIWARRLELCRAELIRPDLAGKSITEIAFACGFSNAAHFSRSFRARFGQSPRDFRQTALDHRPRERRGA